MLTRQGQRKGCRSSEVGKPKDAGQSFLEEVASELGLEEWVGLQHMEATKDSWT